MHQVEVDDAAAAFQVGDGGREATEPVTEYGECPGAVFAAQADECVAGASLVGEYQVRGCWTWAATILRASSEPAIMTTGSVLE